MEKLPVEVSDQPSIPPDSVDFRDCELSKTEPSELSGVLAVGNTIGRMQIMQAEHYMGRIISTRQTNYWEMAR